MSTLDDQLVEKFAGLFAGRTDAAGRLKGNGTSYQEKITVTTDTYRAHLEGARWPQSSLGVYPLTDDGLVRWGAADVDLGDEASAWKIADRMEAHGVRAFVEVSKGKGHHVWCFAREPEGGYAMRAFLRRCLTEAGVAGETFPKQDSITAGNPYGNFIHLPYPGHPEAAHGRYFLGRDGRQWLLAEFLDKQEPAVLPGWARERPAPAQSRTDRLLHGSYGGERPACIRALLAGPVPEGQRNDALARLAAHLITTEADPQGASIARDAALGWGLPEREADRTIASIRDGGRWWGCTGKREVPVMAAACVYEACPFHRSPERAAQGATFRIAAPKAPPRPPPVTPEDTDTAATEARLIDLVAPHGFLRHYVDYCSPLSDAPPVSHLAAALVLVATMLGNHVHMRGFLNAWLRPNIWVVFMAESGARKSSSMSKAIGILTRTKDGGRRLLSNKASIEQWLDELMRYPSRLLHADEFLALYRRFERANMGEARSDFTQLFSVPRHVYSTISRGTQVIENPALSLLAGCTPDELMRHVKREHFASGFLARILWLPALVEAPAPRLVPVVDPARERAIIDRLEWVGTLTGEITYDDATNARLAGWADDFRRRERAGAGAAMGQVNRAFDFAGKFAMIMQVAETEPGARLWRDLDPDVVERAIALTEWLIRSTIKFVNTQLTDSDHERQQRDFLAALDAAGGLATRRQLRRALRALKGRDFDEVAGHLIDAGDVEQGEQRTAGRPLTVYRRAGHNPLSSTSVPDMSRDVSGVPIKETTLMSFCPDNSADRVIAD